MLSPPSSEACIPITQQGLLIVYARTTFGGPFESFGPDYPDLLCRSPPNSKRLENLLCIFGSTAIGSLRFPNTWHS